MQTRWNVSSQYLTPLRTVRIASDGTPVRRYAGPSVAPGDSNEFTDEEAATLGWEWSETDPRAGVVEERDFKRRRDAVPQPVVEPEPTVPAESGDAAAKEDG